jgi:hypothetical protein
LAPSSGEYGASPNPHLTRGDSDIFSPTHISRMHLTIPFILK